MYLAHRKTLLALHPHQPTAPRAPALANPPAKHVQPRPNPSQLHLNQASSAQSRPIYPPSSPTPSRLPSHAITTPLAFPPQSSPVYAFSQPVPASYVRTKVPAPHTRTPSLPTSQSSCPPPAYLGANAAYISSDTQPPEHAIHSPTLQRACSQRPFRRAGQARGGVWFGETSAGGGCLHARGRGWERGAER